MSEDLYADLIRRKLAEQIRAGQTVVKFKEVVQVLAPLEASCGRPRCFESDTCAHLRVNVLYLGTLRGAVRPFTAIFGQGEDPGEPELKDGWA